MLPRATLFLFSTPLLAPAAVTAVHLDTRAGVEQGRSFGSSGPYERISGTVSFVVDPTLPANGVVHDLALAPRNAQGQVEFSADFYLLRPRDPARANGTVLFEVSNRGHKGMVAFFDLASASPNPGSVPGDLGDPYLLEEGYTVVWLGWQFDTPPGDDILHLFSPIAKNPDGTPIRGQVRSDFVPDRTESEASLADMGHQPYAAIIDAPAQLTVRAHVEDPRRLVPRDHWTFTSNGAAVSLQGGFEPGLIYEVLYTAANPPVVGLGPAAIRDFISFLKHGGPSTALGDSSATLHRAIGYGVSQSGRFLRNFLYDGFNADERGRIVFDGVWAHVAGAGRGNFNYRFAQASRDARPFLNFFYPVDIFPFTDLPETDPVTGAHAGLLDRARAASVVPKIFYTNGSYEYWGRAAALIHVTPDGAADAPLAPNTRVYFLAGTQHGPGRLPPPTDAARYPANPNDYRFLLRALLRDMNDWLKLGKEPPPSTYPRRSQLTTPAALGFPKSIDAIPPASYHKAYHADYGPQFLTVGIVAEPPKIGDAFPLLVPRVDADGNDLGGIRLPELAVPLATYTGWNYRPPSTGAPEEMASFIGSFFPFPPAKIKTLYPTSADYYARIQSAATALAAQRLLLNRDIPRLLDRAHEEWSLFAESK